MGERKKEPAQGSTEAGRAAGIEAKAMQATNVVSIGEGASGSATPTFIAIERDAESLLAQCAHARGVELRAPIPIEDIVEKHLKLRVGFDDLHRLLDIPRSGLGLDPDIFGAIWLDSGRIVIDESRDPEKRPAMEGRYCFTLAHEGGHWRLHRGVNGFGSGSVRTIGDQADGPNANGRSIVSSSHAWLHSRCWPAWHASRKAEAIAALANFGITTSRTNQ